jgi:hypothetical protein
MRTRGFPTGLGKPLSLFGDDAPLKAHPLYRRAKAGGAEAAAVLVMDLARPLAEQARADFAPGTVYVAPHALEASGDNAIPQALAEAVANAAAGEADLDIVQTTRVFHTGADPMERLNNRAEFDGTVRQAADYVLVDDVTTMGGTLAELAHYILSNGGRVAGAVVLVNASRTGILVPDHRVVAKLESRHGPTIREVFGIESAALSADEARYLLGFRSADEIRNRSAKAKQETDKRLRTKGIHGVGGEAG